MLNRLMMAVIVLAMAGGAAPPEKVLNSPRKSAQSQTTTKAAKELKNRRKKLVDVPREPSKAVKKPVPKKHRPAAADKKLSPKQNRTAAHAKKPGAATKQSSAKRRQQPAGASKHHPAKTAGKPQHRPGKSRKKPANTARKPKHKKTKPLAGAERAAKTLPPPVDPMAQLTKIMESPAPARPANQIDAIVFAKLKSLGAQPRLCSDAVFVRRVYLDVTGQLPSAAQAKAFIRNTKAKNKRVALIDRLLDEPTHADYWAMKWSDILRVKAEFPVKLWPDAAQAYHHWIWEAIAHNMPYDQFARQLLTSSGSNFRVGPVNFYRAIQNKTPEGIAAAVALALMGTRIDHWPEDRRAGMAVFFSQIGYKPTSEWKEEIVFWDPLQSAAIADCIAPGQDSVAKCVAATNQIPRELATPIRENRALTAVFPDGKKVRIPPNRDPRKVFADWLIRPDNAWFAKAIVNRTWAWIMGRGIIQEPDDIRPDNPPSNPKLLVYLEQEFIASGYDLKHLKRLILTSTTYQLSSIPRLRTPEAEANFASYRWRRLEAEVLNDALNQITGSTDLYTSAVPEPFTYIPKGMHAVAVADGSITSSFLTLFGRSARATGMENERVNQLASPQWLYMLNSTEIQNKLRRGPKLAALVSTGKPDEIIEELYLTILSRFPTPAEVNVAEQYAKSKVVRGRDVWIDLAWALINSPEFLLRH